MGRAPWWLGEVNNKRGGGEEFLWGQDHYLIIECRCDTRM